MENLFLSLDNFSELTQRLSKLAFAHPNHMGLAGSAGARIKIKVEQDNIEGILWEVTPTEILIRSKDNMELRYYLNKAGFFGPTGSDYIVQILEIGNRKIDVILDSGIDLAKWQANGHTILIGGDSSIPNYMQPAHPNYAMVALAMNEAHKHQDIVGITYKNDGKNGYKLNVYGPSSYYREYRLDNSSVGHTEINVLYNTETIKENIQKHLPRTDQPLSTK